jgi:choline kinase
VGYQQDLIRQAARRESFLGEVRFVVNEDFERGSIVSLWAAREELDDDVVIMDADVLYHPMILRRLVDSPFPNALLLDETVGQQTEECMVVVRDGRVIALTKEIPEGLDLTGEGVGFLKVQKADLPVLLQSIQAHLHVGHLDMEYEDALKEFFQEVPVGYEFVGGWPWVEIDHPGDVECAKHEVVPLLPSVDHKVVLGLSDR